MEILYYVRSELGNSEVKPAGHQVFILNFAYCLVQIINVSEDYHSLIISLPAAYIYGTHSFCFAVGMEVTLLRHAQSTANAYGEIDTRNVPITNKGVRQAQGVSGDFDVVLCSPLRRTRQTLENSKITYREMILTPEAREIVDDPCDMLTDDEESDSWSESRSHVTARCERLLEKIETLVKAGKSVLVVSHCKFICSFTSRYAPTSMFLENAQMVRVRLSKK